MNVQEAQVKVQELRCVMGRYEQEHKLGHSITDCVTVAPAAPDAESRAAVPPHATKE